MGRFKYTESEKETLRVLKMQEQQLENFQEEVNRNCQSSQSDEEELAVLRKQIEEEFQKRGLPFVKKADRIVVDIDFKVNSSDIPSWEECATRANQIIKEDVEFEDLLSQEEFNYCIEDVERIHAEFSAKTGIQNKLDLSFLMVATALQTARWLIIQQLCGDLGQTIDGNDRLEHNDSSIKDSTTSANKKFQKVFNSRGHKESAKSYKSWEQIIFSSAPYDTTVGSPKFGEKLEGRYHRYKTLGHDPILGWIFGTANFITDTCTLSNFNSYRISRKGTPHFAEPTNLAQIFYEVFDSVQEDWLRLPAGLFAQFVHLKSDVFTKLGLPVPLLEVFSESMAGKLYKSQYDSLCLMRDIAIIGNQAAWSILINMIIGLVHGFFYDAEKDGDRNFYEVRTRKILCLSNVLASAGNIAYAVGTNDWKKLDVGGILVSLYRLFTDVRFITRVKDEFIHQEMDKVLEKELREIDAHFL